MKKRKETRNKYLDHPTWIASNN